MVRALALVAIGCAVVIAVVVVLSTTRLRDAFIDVGLSRPAPGEARADYLPDGTPVWVMGHDDGTVSVLSGFDTHTPLNLNKLNWWCTTADGLENPAHGSKWDEYGAKIGGPAPTGLPSWDVRLDGNTVLLGDLHAGPAVGAPFVGPPEPDRDWCVPPGNRVIRHTFDGWPVWDSPTEAVAAAPDGWILVNGRLVIADIGAVQMCALSGCDDAVAATGIGIPSPEVAALGDPFGSTRWLARVRDGALVNITQLAFDPAQ
jgi:hypothetical protein